MAPPYSELDRDTDLGPYLDGLRGAAPRPLLPRSAEARLGARHREVLDRLESMFLDRGFSAFTIGDLAAGVGCSRRTLYELAPSKDHLVLLVLDRYLHRTGRAAMAELDPQAPIIEQIRRYVNGGADFTLKAVLYDDLADEPAARRLLDRHFRFSTEVIARLVARGVASGELRDVNPSIVAATIAGSSVYLVQPENLEDIGLPRTEIVDQMLDVILPGLLP
jgi:AcrR family transcriptional regulator